MHGQAKVVTSDAVKEKERKQKLAKSKAYRESMNRIFEKRKNHENDKEALSLISEVLSSHPDVYTLWNFRKEILVLLQRENDEELMLMLPDEFKLTETCLRINPKSYGAWYHRYWLMNNMPEVDLKRELMLCNKFLQLDSRNFHCWDYRRQVAFKLGLSPAEELKYTTEKIEENFSNYSSWHYRSKLLPLVHADPAGVRPIKEETHLHELSLVENAAFTDPNDQSAWFYLRWLLGRLESNLEIIQLYLCQDKELAFVAFNRPASPSDNSILIGLDGCVWTTVDSSKASPLWVARFSEQVQKLFFDIEHKMVPLEESEEDEKKEKFETENVQKEKPETEDDEELEFSIEVIVNIKGVDETIILNKSEGFFWSRKAQFDPEVSPKLMEVLKGQLNSCNQLLELEPDSKWTLLTSVVLMQAINKNEYKDEIFRKIDQLIVCDKYRKNYYNDTKSKYIIEMKLEEMEPGPDISLAGLNLTALYHPQYLSHITVVDLSRNKLHKSVPQLYALVNCEVLRFDKNELETLKGFPFLPKLRVLSLSNNLLLRIENVFPHLESIKTLQTLDIRHNPISDSFIASGETHIQKLRQFLPEVNLLIKPDGEL